MKAFVIDVSRCNGCYCCQVACKDEHVANDWSPYAKPQPDTGQFWLKLNEYVRGTVPKVKMHYLPVLCMHCDAAPCIPSCPIKGALYKRDDGMVIIDADKCTGCKNCVDSCPYGVIYFNDDLNIAQKCTGCAHLLDGKGGAEVPRVPRCVDVCPTEAIKFGEESELRSLIGKGGVLDPASISKGGASLAKHATNPRVYYLNIPKKFVAGTVYDPAKKEVLIGANCTLTGSKGGSKLTAKTDGFGDFWFEGLEVDTYSLKIESDGKSKTVDKISTEKDVNLGDIPVS